MLFNLRQIYYLMVDAWIVYLLEENISVPVYRSFKDSFEKKAKSSIKFYYYFTTSEGYIHKLV